MSESLSSLAINNSASASFEFAGAQVYLNAATADQLLADLAKFGKVPDRTTNVYEAAANKPKSTEVSAAEKSAVAAITAEQAKAVDDTAGLEEQNTGKPAPAADTKPTAAAAKADAPEQKVKPSEKDVPYIGEGGLQQAVFKLAGLVKQKGLDTDQWVKQLARDLGSANGTMADFKDNQAKINQGYALVMAQIAKVEALTEEVA